MLRIAYRESDRAALLIWESRDEGAAWLDALKRAVFDKCDEATQEGSNALSVPWWSFAALRPQMMQIFTGFGLGLGSAIQVEAAAADLLRRATANAQTYLRAQNAQPLAPAEVTNRLNAIQFARPLTPQQLRNVSKIAGLPSGATFSVPGAGKTTEALALFFLKAAEDESLLVVAPKNAFAAWDEQLEICMPRLQASFVRLRGGGEAIARFLEDTPRFMLITYQQFARVRGLIGAYLARQKVHVFLDESHRIKGGNERQAPRAILSVSHLPVSKLIMSGTPMPQSLEDLLPQFNFLYPEIPVQADSVIDLIRSVYVRTTKPELGLRDPNRKLVSLPMAPVQAELYNLMKFELAREAATALSIRTKQAFRALGRSVARLLQFVSNPSLLSNEIEFAHPDLLRAVLAEGDGPKMRYVLRRARDLAYEGKKVLIWSSFVRNVEYLALRLADVGAVYIHGKVDAGDEDDDETREGKIKLFHDSDNVMVLVANPAAASEGISLHKKCHHALYLDRTFNAAHYLQSEDRIHRLGLPPDQETTIEIVECSNTIDETVRNRLGQKVRAMSEALEDPSIRIDPIPLDPPVIEDADDYIVDLKLPDIEALLRDISPGKPQ